MGTLKQALLAKYYNIWKAVRRTSGRIDTSLLAYEANRRYWERKGENRACVYTCITGGYDTVLLHEYVNPAFDYICFTDSVNLLNMARYGAWQFRPLAFTALSDTKNQRWHKTHPHEILAGYDESVYIDANISVRTEFLFGEIASSESGILIPIHFARDCIYDEAKEIVRWGRDSAENVGRMVALLKESGFPRHYGLHETNIVYRKHGDATVRKIDGEWWSFIESYSRRDQMSLSFVLWKNGIAVSDIAIANARTDEKNFYFAEHTGETRGGGKV